MPNWMAIDCDISGPEDQLAEFRRRHFSRDGEGNETLDFNTIIPMPGILEEEFPDSRHEIGVFAIGEDVSKNDPFAAFARSFPTPLEYPWIKGRGISSREELLAYLQRESPEIIYAAHQAVRNFRETGFVDWYKWQLVNWGCKWGAAEFAWCNTDKTSFQFDTPWSFPGPIFLKLSAMYPAVRFDVEYEELGNAIVGEAVFLTGEVVKHYEADDAEIQERLRESGYLDDEDDAVA